jgi:hypothetical protein
MKAFFLLLLESPIIILLNFPGENDPYRWLNPVRLAI